jgi:hypothetical protein
MLLNFVVLLVASLVAWLVVLITALARFAVLQLVFLPKFSSRLRVSPAALCLLLWPTLTAVGWALHAREGLLAEIGFWSAGFALPWLAIRLPSWCS